MLILNLGCGNQKYGDVRVDIHKTSTVNIVADLETSLPFRDEIFDIVYSRCVFEHLRNPSIFLREIIHVLKKRGTVQLITDNAAFWRFHIVLPLLSTKMSLHNNYLSTGKHDKHYALYTIGHLKNHFEAASLTITKIYYTNPLERRFVNIDRLLRLIPQLQHLVYPWIYVEAHK